MVRLTTLIVLFQFFFTIQHVSFSQTQTEDTQKDSTEKDKALEFYFLNEQSLAFRSSICENFYWKASLDVSAYFWESEEEKYGDFTERVISQSGIRIELQLFTSIYSNDYWGVDIGVGPSINYYKYKSITDFMDTNETLKDEDISFGYGAQATLLAQLNLTDRIFLISKYDYRVIYYQTEHVSDAMQLLGAKDITKSWSVVIGGIKMGVGIYF